MTAFEVCEARSGEGLADAAGRAADVLRAGGILAHPTETVYGFGGAARPEIDRELARLKGRSGRGASAVLRIAASTAIVRKSLPEAVWSPAAERLAAAFWPGPVTLVLPLRSGGSVAVRVEGDPATSAVLARWGGLMGSTSLNRAGEPPARTRDEAVRCLRAMPSSGLPVLLLDAGDLAGPPPSTLVSLTTGSAVILRQGAVSAAAIEDCLKDGGGA